MARPERFGAQLPAVPCTNDLRERVADEAKLRQTSMVQVVRDALLFYFSERSCFAGQKPVSQTKKEPTS